jgi:hypothetical protein
MRIAAPVPTIVGTEQAAKGMQFPDERIANAQEILHFAACAQGYRLHSE